MVVVVAVVAVAAGINSNSISSGEIDTDKRKVLGGVGVPQTQTV